MPQQAAHVRFVDAVHRRMVLQRVLEACLVSIPAGSLIAALHVAIGCVVTGIIFTGWMIRHWPSRDQAAATIDSQFQWSELTRSARAASMFGSDELATAVMAAADARCRSASVAELKLSRLRSVHGAAVVVGLLIALAVWITPKHTNSNPNVASDESTSPLRDRPAMATAVDSKGARPPVASNDPDEPSQRGGAEENSTSHFGDGSHSDSDVTLGTGAGFASANGLTKLPTVSIDAVPTQRGTMAVGDGTGSASKSTVQGSAKGVVAAAPSAKVSTWADRSDRFNPKGGTSTTSSVPVKDADLVRAFFER